MPMCYSCNFEDDKPPGTKYFVAHDLEVEKVILYFDDNDEMGSEIRVDIDVDSDDNGNGNVKYSSSDPNIGYKMRSEIGVDNDICGDARVKMDYDDELDDYYIFSNEVKDEWIDSLQVDFSTSSTLNDASSSDND
jgi:hypothetical protein